MTRARDEAALLPFVHVDDDVDRRAGADDVREADPLGTRAPDRDAPTRAAVRLELPGPSLPRLLEFPPEPAGACDVFVRVGPRDGFEVPVRRGAGVDREELTAERGLDAHDFEPAPRQQATQRRRVEVRDVLV